MPPKKGSSKKPEKSRTPILIDGLTKDEISKEQVYRQKMRHLLCEHQNTVCELTADQCTSKEAMQADQTKLENRLRNEAASLLIDLHQVDTETPIMELKMKHQEEMVNLKEISEKKLQDVEAKYEKMRSELQLDLENQRKTEVSEARDNWSNFISALVEKDTGIYEDVKVFFKNTEKTSEVNNELKQSIADETTTLRQQEKVLSQTLKENQQLTENLSKLQEEIAQLENKMKYKPKKFDNKKEFELNNLAHQHETLQNLFKELQMEEAELRKTYAETLEKMQNKAEAKHKQMEKKIQHLTDRIQKNLLIPKH